MPVISANTIGTIADQTATRHSYGVLLGLLFICNGTTGQHLYKGAALCFYEVVVSSTLLRSSYTTIQLF